MFDVSDGIAVAAVLTSVVSLFSALKIAKPTSPALSSGRL